MTEFATPPLPSCKASTYRLGRSKVLNKCLVQIFRGYYHVLELNLRRYGPIIYGSSSGEPSRRRQLKRMCRFVRAAAWPTTGYELLGIVKVPTLMSPYPLWRHMYVKVPFKSSGLPEPIFGGGLSTGDQKAPNFQLRGVDRESLSLRDNVLVALFTK